ncbi:hypothetical protein C900_05916 [Fulvivirga imtechensis AK7]|uniref:Uncharacterized protein n=1 Tax=Fulvivirga imtechensis AK7 TaxID=1237149 RepID=L8JKJ3_9BACT|nr:hypothetical protein [Fulvivirga imtechensis]ELR68733.1 hypothetical protein C900_05916 [Fulvivirga imtechensis AK7]
MKKRSLKNTVSYEDVKRLSQAYERCDAEIIGKLGPEYFYTLIIRGGIYSLEN